MPTQLPFLDTLPSDEFYGALRRAFVGKIIASNTYFRPYNTLTRAEAITLLVRSTKLIPTQTTKDIFEDVKVGSSHAGSINTFAQYLGIQ